MTDLAFSLKSQLRRYPGITQISRSLRKSMDPGLQWAGTHLGPRTGRHFTQASRYFTRNRVAGYIGWVGNGNIGDEAIFLAFRRLFPQFQALLYDRPPFEILLHRKLISREPFYDFVTLGGGTLFSYRCYYYQLENALRLGVPVWTFGTGVDDPDILHADGSSPPQADREEHFALLRDFVRLLKQVPVVTVRGPRTAKVMQGLGADHVRVTGDPALGACSPIRATDGKRALVNLAMWKDRGGPVTDRVISALAAAVKYLLDTGWHVDYLPTARGDHLLGKRLQQELPPGRVNILPYLIDPVPFIDRLSGYDMLIGERLHSLVLAAGCGVPIVALEYSPKCRDFMESIAMERFCIPSADQTPPILIAAIDEANTQREAINRDLNARCDAYRSMQRDAAADIVKLLSPVAAG